MKHRRIGLPQGELRATNRLKPALPGKAIRLNNFCLSAAVSMMQIISVSRTPARFPFGGKVSMRSVIVMGVVWMMATGYLFLAVISDRYRRLRKPAAVSCPETGRPAEIEMGRRQALMGAVLGSQPYRVDGCTNWPRAAQCNQACLGSFAAVSLVRSDHSCCHAA